jgi:hypothetical protein
VYVLIDAFQEDGANNFTPTVRPNFISVDCSEISLLSVVQACYWHPEEIYARKLDIHSDQAIINTPEFNITLPLKSILLAANNSLVL